MDAESCIRDIIAALPDRPRAVVAVDGRSCAGKTTLSSRLAHALGGSVVHMDDFFLPLDLRTPERLAQPGGNVHYERFELEVLPFLGGNEPFSYLKFDCSVMDYNGSVLIPAGPVVIEGAYSLSPRFGRYYDLAVFMDISPERQKERLLAREGEQALDTFLSRWIPMEEHYISAFGIDRSGISIAL